MLEHIPVGILSLLVVIVILGSVWMGFLASGKRRLTGTAGESPEEQGVAAVVAALFGLLAFMLAFTFGLAAARREVRRDLLLDEVNSIGTTYLRAGLTPEPHRSQIRQELRDYVDLRIDAVKNRENLQTNIQKSKDIQKRLWAQAEEIADDELQNADIVSLFIDSLNETIDLQTKRVVVGGYRIPSIVWVVFLALTVLAGGALGYGVGLKSKKLNWTVAILLSVSFAAVAFLIFDLDRVAEGWLTINQGPMYELRSDLEP
jgi:hypothetical protein